ncbi:MAG TPA: alpha-L-fucosidase [Bryobacteraceae bacterium]|jgi:alpha-L-fucosidase|nr:alpha-L-fucosidase [Bryobacteraceae bacterium]
MISRRTFLAAAPAAIAAHAARKVPPPQPYGALPSSRQLAWHNLEFTAFLHFTVNTFTNKEWGYGDEDPNIFQPSRFDADAIAENLKSTGVAGFILTCKHHDGFCLWPTKTTDHSIRSSSWRNGQGDIVRDLSAAARRAGLKFGVYLSPWDRNNASYGTPQYIEIYRRQLTELLTQYGEIFEVWHDGANGGDGYYGGAREKRTIDKRTYYDWPATWELVRKLQPQAVIFSDVGPDVRWVGNERGIAGDPCWACYDPVGADGGAASPGDVRERESPTGTWHGSHWLPAECDVSIRPGWFWHESENARVKTPVQLVDLYYKSVGRGANLLLNVPPNRLGVLGQEDVASLRGLHDYLAATFADDWARGTQVTASNVRGKQAMYDAANLVDGQPLTSWATDDEVRVAFAALESKRPVTFSVIAVKEDIRYGQRVDAFAVERWNNGDWEQVAAGTSIGPRRYLRLERPVTASRVRLRITQASASPVLSQFSLYSEPAQVGQLLRPAADARIPLALR